MDSPDAPVRIARQALNRLAKERLAPVPANYCRAYRDALGITPPWVSICRQTALLEEVLGRLLAPWSRAEAVLDEQTAQSARSLSQRIHQASSEADLVQVRSAADTLGASVHDQLINAAEMQAGLVDLVRLITANVGDLAGDDQWLQGQVHVLEELLNGVLTPAKLNKALLFLRGVINKQRELRGSLSEAQNSLKALMARLVEQAGALAQSTTGYEAKISDLGRHIESADDLHEIKSVVGELGAFVHDMGSRIRHSREEMADSHARLIEAETQVAQLRQELADTSERARRDNLTGAMNRSGLEQMWARELARAAAERTPLSLGMLDIDNFKKLNDTYGHKTGDEALVHLVAVVREALRGIDTVARYGGEEFVILLPDTDSPGAEAVLQRLQRELTKRFFLHDNERVLITFSAGVTAVRPEADTLASAVARADSALYEAKRAGKNRVNMA